MPFEVGIHLDMEHKIIYETRKYSWISNFRIQTDMSLKPEKSLKIWVNIIFCIIFNSPNFNLSIFGFGKLNCFIFMLSLYNGKPKIQIQNRLLWTYHFCCHCILTGIQKYRWRCRERSVQKSIHAHCIRAWTVDTPAVFYRSHHLPCNHGQQYPVTPRKHKDSYKDVHKKLDSAQDVFLLNFAKIEFLKKLLYPQANVFYEVYIIKWV